MSNKSPKTALPKLRFPEFRAAGAWDIMPLGSIAKLVKEKAGSNRYKLMSITSGSGLVSQMEKFGREIAGESYKNYYVIKKGDFAYNKSSTKLDPEGQIALLENEELGAVPNSIFTCFRVDEKTVLPSFLKYPFTNNAHGEWLRNFIQIGARANGALAVDNKDLLALPLAIPSLPEQQKIATTLSSLDALLTAQRAKLEALQDHKRGLMQELFPAEGETVPKRRFPEFREVGEWMENTLGNIILKVVTGPFGSMLHQTDYVEEGIPVVNPQNIVDGAIVPISKTMIREETFKRLKKYALKTGDIVIARRGEMGRCAVAKEENENWLCGTGSFIIRMNPEKSNSDFVNLIIGSEGSKQHLENSSIGATMSNLNQDILTELPVIIPSLVEQQKIADCLTSIDNLITAQSERIEALRLHKKGLMQALFPAASEPEA